MQMRVASLAAGLLVLTSAAMVVAQPSPRSGARQQLTIAEKFIDSFYSFEPAPLQALLASATEASRGEILFYQDWAEGGHYKVIRRSPCHAHDNDQVECAITVEDDLAKALRFTFNVTDTFHLSIASGEIVSVTVTSDDPPLWEQAKAWVRKNRPELIEEPCRGYFAGGPTPGACVRAMVQGFEEFASSPDFPITD
jgi:hypothetical protein